MSRLTSYRHDGLTFDVLDEGPEDGEAVVLLHGFPQRASSWEYVVPLLHAQGLRTIAPDQRGYSPGARPRGRRAYTMQHLTDDVVALVEQLSGTTGAVHLVGHDWGACIAWLVAAQRPDLVQTLTTASVPHPAAFLRSMRNPAQLRKSWYMAFFQLPWIPERALSNPDRSRSVLRAAGMSDVVIDRALNEVLVGDTMTAALSWYRAMPFGLRAVARSGRVRVPTTHVWSDQDIALGEYGATLARHYVDADYRLEVLHGVSHWIPEEAPEVFARILIERIDQSRGI